MSTSIVRAASTFALGIVIAVGIPVAAAAAPTPGADPALDSHAAVATASSTSPVFGFWLSGGALGLVAGAIAVGATVRRNRVDAEH